MHAAWLSAMHAGTWAGMKAAAVSAKGVRVLHRRRARMQVGFVQVYAIGPPWLACFGPSFMACYWVMMMGFNRPEIGKGPNGPNAWALGQKIK